MKAFKTMTAAAALAVAAFGASAQEIKVGISISTTGPAAALGIPERNAIAFWPAEIGGVKVTPIILDDEGDPTKATANARRLISEDKVDVIAGSSTTPPTIAVSNVAKEAGVPHFGLGPMPFGDGREKWTVILPQPVPLMGKQIYGHMAKNKVKTVGFIGFADSYGDLWKNDLVKQGEALGLKLTAEERYARSDTSVAAQALKLALAKPDAILIAASGTGAALPQTALRERGYTGPIYQTHGAVSNDFIRIGGKAAEGAFLASGPVMVAEDQDAKALTKAPGMALNTAYEAKYGPGSRSQFAAHGYDMGEVLKRIIPAALKSGAKPGTPDFREALRKALISEKEIAASQGVYNFTETDRFGVDDRAAVLLTVKNGKFELVK